MWKKILQTVEQLLGSLKESNKEQPAIVVEEEKAVVVEENMAYTVNFYKGDYSARQAQANKDKCICYVEHHFNAGSSTADYVVVVVGKNASNTSKNWGKLYARKISETFGNKIWGEDGVLVGGYQGRGNSNLILTKMPAILVEPFFVSNPKQAEIVRSESGQNKLAKVLVDTIKETFPKNSVVGFSVGHKYKTSKPKDRGAAVVGGGTEADFAEIVLQKAAKLLEGGA